MKTNAIIQTTTALVLSAMFALPFTSCSDDMMEELPEAPLCKPMFGEDRTKDEFLTNWENCNTVKIAGVGDEIYCPWYGAAAQNIPDYVRFDTKKEIAHQIGMNDLLVDDYELAGNKIDKPSSAEVEMSDKDKCTLIKLLGSHVYVYGRHLSLLGKEMVMMPQVFVPFEKGGTIYQPVIPDFLVTVTITFKCDEGCMQFSKTFLPEVKLIGHNDLKNWYTKLKGYSDLCATEQPVGKLANNASISVYDKHSDLFLRRTLKMLERMK